MVLSYPMSRIHGFTRTYVKNTGRISQGRGGVAVGHNGRPDLADRRAREPPTRFGQLPVRSVFNTLPY